MLQFASRKPREAAKITGAKVTYLKKSKQYVLHLDGDYDDVFPERVELDIDGDWLMIRGNYKEGYRRDHGDIKATAEDETHRKAIIRFVGHEWKGMGYNREAKMFGFKLGANELGANEERQISALFPRTNEEWKDFWRSDSDNPKEPERWAMLGKSIRRLMEQNREEDVYEIIGKIMAEGGDDDE